MPIPVPDKVPSSPRFVGDATKDLNAVREWIDGFVRAQNGTNGDVVLRETDTVEGIGFVVDEDDFSSESQTKVATQSSTKAYVDASVSSASSAATAATKYNKRYILADEVWVKPANLTKVIVTPVGGGGGGGALGTTADNTAAGSGAGGGAAIKTILAANLNATETVVVGPAGTAGTAGAAGGTGGTSSSGSHCSATGGTGGNGLNTVDDQATHGIGGLGVSGDINLRGGQAGNAADQIYATSVNLSFPGGSSALGFAGAPGLSASGIGNSAPANSGAGASGAMALASGTARNGGTGGSGLVIIEEFFGPT